MNCSLHTRRWLFAVTLMATLAAFVLLALSASALAGSNIYGTVTDAETERPIDGATVYMSGEENEYETSTNRDGEYSLDCESGKYEISISADGYQSHRDSITLEEGEEKQYDAKLEKEEEENSKIYGYVTDKDTEEPIEEARVHVYNKNKDYYAQTDEGGYYEVICYAGHYTIEVERSGYKKYTGEEDVAEDEAVQHDVALESEGPANSKVYGQVTDAETGDGLSEASVRLKSNENSYSATTDDTGNYEIQCHSGEYDVTVNREGYQEHYGQVAVEEEDEVEYNAELEQEEGEDSTVYGQVTDKDTGEGLGASVKLDGEKKSYETFTDRSGNYEIQCYADDYRITVESDGYKTHYGEVKVGEGEEVQYDVQLEKEDPPDSQLHGTVTDAETEDPIGEAMVRIENSDNKYSATTDKEGYYEIDCNSGDYEISISASGYETHYGEVTVKPGDDNEYDAALEPTEENSRVYGYVTDADTGEPIDMADVYLRNSDNSYSTRTDREGYYEIQCASGEYDITISKEGYKTHYGQVKVVDDEEVKYDAELNRDGSQTYLDGYVRDAETEEPVNEAKITLEGPNGNYEGYSDKEGYYYISCEPGEYDMLTQHPDYEDDERRVEMKEGANQEDVFLEPTPSARVYGYVKDKETGDTLMNAKVRFRDKDSGETTDVETDGEGWYSVELSPEDFDIYVSKEEYEDLEDEISLEDDDEEQRDFELTPEIKTGEVWGNVKDNSNNNNIEGATLTFTDKDTTDEFTATTDEYGDYAIDLVEGNYDISIDHQDFQTRTDELTVEGDRDYERNYLLEPRESLLSGKVLDKESEDGVEDATVTVTAKESRDGEPYSKTVDTESDGDYELSLPAGDYEITIEHEDYLKYWDNVTMVNGEDNEQDFEVTPRERVGSVAGRVTETGTETPLWGATVVFTGSSRAEDTATTDEYGDYEITLPEGDYDISVEMEGYESTADTITIEDEEEYQRDYEIAIISEPPVEELGPVEGDLPDGASYSVTAGVTGPGDLEVDATISPDSEDDKNLGLFLDIQFDGAEEDLKWVHIIIYYNEVADGLKASRLMIYYWDVDAEDWELAEETGVDTTNQFVWANVTHLTVFGPRDVTGAVVKNYGVSVTGSQEITVKAGEEVTFSLTIENSGEEQDTFEISLSGAKGDWGSLDVDEVTLDAGEDRTFIVTVTVPAETPAGTYNLKVTATSQGDPQVEKTLTLTTTVESDAESEDNEWYEETVNLGGIISVIIVVVIVVALLLFRKRNADTFDEWGDDEDSDVVW